METFVGKNEPQKAPGDTEQILGWMNQRDYYFLPLGEDPEDALSQVPFNAKETWYW